MGLSPEASPCVVSTLTGDWHSFTDMTAVAKRKDMRKHKKSEVVNNGVIIKETRYGGHLRMASESAHFPRQWLQSNYTCMPRSRAISAIVSASLRRPSFIVSGVPVENVARR